MQTMRNGQKKVIPVLRLVSDWYTANYYCCHCCNFSVYAFLSRSVKTKEVRVNERTSCSDDNEDTLDSFTDRLVQEKTIKWGSLNNKMKKPSMSREESNQLEENKSKEEINCQKIQESTTHSFEITKQCLHDCHKMKINPRKSSLSYGINVHEVPVDTEKLLTDKDVCNIFKSPEYTKLASYELQLADAMWRNGHFENALNLFWNIYAENMNVRKNVKYMLRLLFADAICKKGEAVLVLIMNFSKKFMKKYNDYTLMSYVWEPCFLSKWHSDNQIASELLESFPELKDIVRLRVHHITSVSLISHDIAVVQRLFEVLLKYDMKTQYELVLRSLFDYACSVRDFYACSAIVQSCIDLNVTLTDIQNARFLNLFCQDDFRRGAKLSIKTWETKPSEFTFKF